MKILMMITNPPWETTGGAETFVREVSKKLAEKHEVHVLCEKRGNYPEYEVIDNVHIHRFAYLNIPKIRVWSLPRAMYKAGEEIIKQYGIEVINPHIIIPSGFVGLKLSEKYGIPASITTHETGGDYLEKQINNSLLRGKLDYVFENTKMFTVPTKYSEGVLSKYTNSKINIIPNGYSDHTFNPEKYQKKEIGKVGICVATFNGYAKRQDILIEATKILKKDFPEIKIRFVGRGDNYKEKKQVEEGSLTGNVEFVGGIKPDEVPKILASSKFFALPTNYESFGMAAIEAMAMELPVIVPDVPPFREYIEDGIDGLIVPLTAEGFAEGIRKVLSGEKLRKRLSENATQKAKKFTWDKVTIQFEEMLWKLQK